MTDDSDPQDNDVPLYPDKEPFMLDGEFQNLPSYPEIGAVPIEELEALADEWRSKYDADEVLPAWESGDDYGRRECANELHELIAEYRSGADE